MAKWRRTWSLLMKRRVKSSCQLSWLVLEGPIMANTVCTVRIPQGGLVGQTDVSKDNEQAMMSAVMQQPVSVVRGSRLLSVSTRNTFTSNVAFPVPLSAQVVYCASSDECNDGQIDTPWDAIKSHSAATDGQSESEPQSEHNTQEQSHSISRRRRPCPMRHESIGKHS